ncbi:MAG: LacI family DNA-binding transcriptional regulator [Lawsonibacter sp.]|jgi:LacI family transcriptional regulator
MGNLTIRDIARLSGCGVATVSRVLNHSSGVSEGTRQRVLDVIQAQGFQPNKNAKHLKQQAETGVAILVKGSQNMLFASMVEVAQRLLRENGQDAAVYYLDEEANEVSYAACLCRERKPKGILFFGGDLAFFQVGFGQIEVPSVLLTNSARDLNRPNLASVTADDRQAAAQAVEYLAQNGHRCIGLLGGNRSDTQISALRLKGFREAMERLGLAFDEEQQWECCRYSMADGWAAAGRLMDRCPEITAVFAMSDVVAVGAMRAVVDRGGKIPRDLSVVGCDGIPLASYCIPRLTTLGQDAQRLAQRGVELLLMQMERLGVAKHEIIPFVFMEGESVTQFSQEGDREEGNLCEQREF